MTRASWPSSRPASATPSRCPRASTNALHASYRLRGATRLSSSLRRPRSYAARAAAKSGDGAPSAVRPPSGSVGSPPSARRDRGERNSAPDAPGGCIANRALMPPDNTVTAISPARAGREIALQQHLFLAAETRNSNVTGPTPMRSPSRSQVGAPTTVPFSSTPFTDARSSSSHAAPCRSIRAWVRETPASFSTRSLEPARPMLTDSASNRNLRPRPLPAAMVRAKAISEAPSKEHLVSDRPEEHQEQRGKDEQDERQEQLHRRFVGESLRPLRALVPHLSGKDSQDVPERRSELVGMHERLHERGERRQIEAPREIAQRLFLRLAQPQLADRDAQLLAQRTLSALLDHLGEGGGEVEPGLDAEREQIDGIRQRPHDGALSRSHAVAQPDQGIR